MDKLKERYIQEVVKNLPHKQRADISKELDTTIDDMVSAKVSGKTNDEVALKSVLVELGRPEELAQNYTDEKQYLIGPKLFHFYKMVLIRVLLVSLPIVFAVSIVTGLYKNEFANIIELILGSVGKTFSTGTIIAFWITLFFAFIERNKEAQKEIEEEFMKEWKPESLPKLEPKRQVSVTDSASEIITGIIGVGFLIYLYNGPIFNLDVWRPVGLALIIVELLGLLLHSYMLAAGRWNMPAFIYSALIHIATIVVSLVILSLQNLLSPEIINSLISYKMPDPQNTIRSIIAIVTLIIVLTSIYEVYNSWRKLKQQ